MSTTPRGSCWTPGWFAGSLLLAYAPWVGRARRSDGEAASTAAQQPLAATDRQAEARATNPSRPISGSLSALTPYLAAAVCTLGILYNSVDGRDIDRVVLYTGCTVVLALVLRQGIMLLDNITLTRELAQKENHFRSLVQGSSDVIMITAAAGTLRYVSPAAAGVYGRSAEDMVGCELSSLVHPEDLGQVNHELRRFLATSADRESSTRVECRFRHGDGHWLNVESTVNRYQGGLIFNSRDVTERVRLQAQLQHNASHDALTDLPNRALFTERVRQAIGGRRGGATAVPPCSSSTWTASRRSTTPSATRRATNSWCRRHGGCTTPCVPATPRPGWAATSSPSSSAATASRGGCRTPNASCASTTSPTGCGSRSPTRTASRARSCGSPPPSASPSPSPASRPVP